jgi:type VI secretion system FHA domain protein
MLISDDAEAGKIQRLNKANAAALRLADDFAPANPHTTGRTKVAVGEQPPATPADSGTMLRRTEPPPVSAAAYIVHRPAPPPAPPAPPKPPAAAVKPAPAPAARISAPAAPAAAAPAPPAPTINTSAAAPTLDAFFRGAGLPPQRLNDKQAEQILQRLGQIMREVVVGVSENLHLRAEQKNVMRVPTTSIQPQNNNPLKFSAGVEEALTNLLFRESPEYLSAVDAVRETFGDIKQHQQQMLNAVRTAVVDYVNRLDPEELESKVSNGRNGLINAANKLKYWDLFKDLFQVVSQHQPGQFPQQFVEELARAYELEQSRAVPASAARHAKIG